MTMTAESIVRASDILVNADSLVILASNGFSITEGINLFATGESFSQVFGDFEQRCGIHSILEGLMTNWSDPRAQWAYRARLWKEYSADYQRSMLTESLKTIIGRRPYFIVTSNGEQHFQRAGFDANSIFEVEGSWNAMRCSRGCSERVAASDEMLAKLAAATKDCRIPEELVPTCPNCGAPLTFDFRPAPNGAEHLAQFIDEHEEEQVAFLELGVGSRNQLIKAPLMRLAASLENASYLSFNRGDFYFNPALEDRTLAIDGPLQDTLGELAQLLRIRR